MEKPKEEEKNQQQKKDFSKYSRYEMWWILMNGTVTLSDYIEHANNKR